MNYRNNFAIDYEQEAIKCVQTEEIENKIYKIKCEQDKCMDYLNQLVRIKEKIIDYQWELKVMFNQSVQHDYLGKVVVPNIFEGIGASKIKDKFEEFRGRMYEYTEELSGIIYCTEQQIARLQRHIGDLDAEIQNLRIML